MTTTLLESRREQPSATVRISLLGGFHAERDNLPIPDDAWQRRSARSLVKLLALQPSHRLHREQIEDILWPDASAGSTSGQFRKALHFARHALEPELAPRQESSFIHLTDDLVTLDTARCQVDADLFQAIATDALATRDCDVLDQARARYTGTLLPEDRYEDWTTNRRDALASLHRAVLLELATIREQRGLHTSAAELLRQLLQEDPAQEELHQRLMRLAVASGSRHEAIHQYQACKAALREELGAEPDTETDALYREILAGHVAHEPSIATVLPASVRRQPTMPLVGRESVLDGLRRDAAQAASGNGRAVLVSGEMGVGKSRLVAELARREHQAGAMVLWGAAYEQEAQVPYGPLAEALDSYLVNQGAAERARLTGSHQEMASLLPALGTPAHEQSELARDRRPRLFTNIVRFLTDIAGDRPLLLVLDDLHAAHDSTLELFHHLARAASQRRWLIVGVYRYDLTMTTDLRHLSSAISQHGLGRHVDLLRLSRQDCGMILAGMLEGGAISQALLDEVYTWSLGNALFANVISRELLDHGSVVRDGDSWIPIPGSASRVPRQIRELVEARIDRLGGDAQKVLSLAAIAGLDCSYTLLRAATSLNEDTLLDALDLALAAHIIDEQGDGYVFAHPIYRETLHDRLPRPRRARLHAALAEAIEGQGVDMDGDHPASVEALAFHLIEAGESRRAIPWLIEAADHATRVYASTDAIDRLTRALRLIDDAAFPPDQSAAHKARIWQRLAGLYALAGNTALAYDACCHALDTGSLAPGDAAGMHRLAAKQSLAKSDLSSAKTHLARAELLLDHAEPGESANHERLQVLITTAQMHFMANRFEDALTVAETSAELARTLGSEADLAQALEMISTACLPLGQWKRGLEHERQHAGLVDLNRFVRDVADVHFCFADFHVYASEPAENARTFERALAESERIEAPRSVALCHYFLGVMSFFRGDFQQGTSHLTHAIQYYRAVESPFGEAISRMVRGVTRTALGQLDDGRHDLERGIEIARTGPMRSHALTRLYAGMCRNRLDANDAAGARFYAEAGLQLTEEPGTCICYGSFLPGAAAAFAVTGDLDRASDLSQRALDVNDRFGSPAFLCMAWQSAGMVHALTGTWAPAFDALDEARQLAAAHGFPYELARVLLLRSFVHLQRRDRGDLAAATRLMAEASSPLLRLGVRTSAAQLRSSMGFLLQNAG